MEELIINTHMHTRLSDGFGNHSDIARAALNANLDAVIVTDHNIWVNGLEGYHRQGKKKLLLLIGEEIHNRDLKPQRNHLLVFGAGRELAMYAADTQRLLDQVNQSNGLSFLAHPNEDAMPAFGEPEITWENWDVKGYTGIELWNGFSELKTVAHSKIEAIFYAFFPKRIPHGPHPDTLRKWDDLLASGRKVVAICGSDAHALPMHLGPVHRVIFPYEFHFRMVNNHVLTPVQLTGDLAEDRRMILQAMRSGHSFIGYDLPASTRGFRFTAQGREGTVQMGDEITARGGVTLQVRLPVKAECRLIQDGKPVRTWQNRDVLSHITAEPGIYRVEAYIDYLGKRRGWIFSNPIYVTA